MKNKSIIVYGVALSMLFYPFTVNSAVLTDYNAENIKTGNHSPVIIFQGVNFNLGIPAEQEFFLNAFKSFLNQNVQIKAQFENIFGKLDNIHAQNDNTHNQLDSILALVGKNGSNSEIESKLKELQITKEGLEKQLTRIMDKEWFKVL